MSAADGLVKKLRLGPGMRALLVHAPPGYTHLLGSLPDGVRLATRGKGPFDFAQLFARNAADLARFAPKALDALRYDGVLWMTYPKSTSGVQRDLHRDRGWRVLEARGLRPVAAVAIDDTWSALRFRPAAEVKRRSQGR